MAPLPSALAPILPLLMLALLRPPPAAAADREITSFSISQSPWRPSHNLTLVSKNGAFAAGFRSANASSPNQFLFCVWVQRASDKTVVWAHDSNHPVGAAPGLAISASGALSLNNSSGVNVWPGAATARAANLSAAVLVLNDRGSLVFGPNSWSSFYYPTDTVLANVSFSSLKRMPRSGDYELNASSTTSALVFNGTGYGSIGTLLNFSNAGKIYFASTPTYYIAADYQKKPLRRLTLDPDGNLRLYSLIAARGTWRVTWQAVQELCTIPGLCGHNAICMPVNDNATSCACPSGFSGGGGRGAACTRKRTYAAAGSKFIRMDFVVFGSPNALTARNLDKCQAACSTNTSCVAFSYVFTGARKCSTYASLDGGYWSPSLETATYVQVAQSETDTSEFTGMTDSIETVCPVRISLPEPPKQRKTTARNIAIITALFTLELLAGVLSFWAFLRKYSKYRDMARTFGLEFLPAGGPKRFTYAELKAATNDFANVVGRGGYGVVYKGELPDRRVVAVKRLRSVGGGEAEFWAEVTIIARMHHLNLVRMWGFCAEREQRMLVYEYVPNGSLDKYLFRPSAAGGAAAESEEDCGDDPSKKLVSPQPLLDLNTRYRIALGVARAIAYLHEECLEWVLHCDIKPENILLEDDFCPKVSDFGLSKLTSKKDKVTMSRIRGTRGYMAPEWVIQREPITAKADVYSFGMVLLETVSGRRNYDFRQGSLESEDWYFPKWAFEKVYVEKKVEDLVDPRIMEAAYDGQAHAGMVDRMVKTALWCLQDRAEMRPSMGKVAKMIEGTVEITEPAKPAIFCLPDESDI